MASLRAKQISGSKYTAGDEIETRFQYDGDMQSCVQYIELLSGVDVTHGGGTAADERLHYKATERDADENGIINYTTTKMRVVQAQKGESVIKVVFEIITKPQHDAWVIEYQAWLDEYVTQVTLENGDVDYEVDDGAPDRPDYPVVTVYKSGEIVLEWRDDTFV